MRTEEDIIGKLEIPKDALYGIHSVRARENFPSGERFHLEWYRAMGTVKLAAYQTVEKFRKALLENDPEQISLLKIPEQEVIEALKKAAEEVAEGLHFEHFITPAIQGGAGTSINLNINEIIANRALILSGRLPGDYQFIDPIEDANIYQSTNDVVPTSLVVSVMRLLDALESSVNDTRKETERLEKEHRNTLRLGYTQLQEAVPSTYGLLFSTYSDALSRDWWRISKSFERIKQVNLGGGAIGTGISIPRFYIMEVVQQLRNIVKLPVAQGENLSDITANQDAISEVHGILRSHAINLEKMAGDLRLLSSGLHGESDLKLPARQTGSSIMPGKINPVIPEFILSSAHKVYANDQLITRLSGMGQLDLNAYLPSIGHSMLDSLKLLIGMNTAIAQFLLKDLIIDKDQARERLFKSPAITTALSPMIGYAKAAELAKYMKSARVDIFEANSKLQLVPEKKLKKMMLPEFLLKKGFSVKDIRSFNDDEL